MELVGERQFGCYEGGGGGGYNSVLLNFLLAAKLSASG